MRVFPPQFETFDKAHGRLEIRRIWASTRLNDYIAFPYAQQVFAVQREITQIKSNKKSIETVYGITSLPQENAMPELLLEYNRGHWSIENKVHYVRDVTFDEDRSQVRTKQGPQVMASLRNFAMGVIRLLGLTSIASALREFAAKPSLAISVLGMG